MRRRKHQEKTGKRQKGRKHQLGGFYDAFRARQTNQLKYLYHRKKKQRGSGVKPRQRTVGKILYNSDW